tara:strand:+ start:1026 stop:1874 length:849 start_codon:yes stop_codon:yes gene_type:complete
MSGVYSFSNVSSNVRHKHLLDCPIAGTVSGEYRFTASAFGADGTDDILQSRLNSSNVVYYLLEEEALLDGAWVPKDPVSESVDYLLKDDSGEVLVINGRVINAFSREVNRGDIRRREAMLMVGEPVVAVGKIHLGEDGTRTFSGEITPSRFHSSSGGILLKIANYAVYINIFFCVVTIAADYRSSRYGRGIQTVVCMLTTYILILCYQLCLYREGQRPLFDQYNSLRSQLITKEQSLPRGEWIIGVDAFNGHVSDINSEARSFPMNLSVAIFDLQVPQEIER